MSKNTLHPETLAVHAGWNGDPAIGIEHIDDRRNDAKHQTDDRQSQTSRRNFSALLHLDHVAVVRVPPDEDLVVPRDRLLVEKEARVRLQRRDAQLA